MFLNFKTFVVNLQRVSDKHINIQREQVRFLSALLQFSRCKDSNYFPILLLLFRIINANKQM